ncbi:hypothetical protein Lqui_0931 [Legionella quinlivanii]|uniref:Uncharacterized protein n=1 Tax=Legionella quinlivanii TaxID=45073 RepID=A0A0W0Y535_9GAMM|nr:hypothetical protein [Legionella quinlivanii]KTD52087.1 hypothetical protein Lqui_0931 [Legionella quinlivanii]MCW8452351.1 hypothetical protein [Legionella quinlivanii]SEF89756.1 hypothetical protein SAMN02746093_01394 [Legionella quinlivanii DSM 21216]STY12417.1 Uncharacterised protein [Legionella quinlivanii]
METFYQILGIAAAGLIVWYLYRTVKNRPELFSRENMSKSFGTMGVLAIILIAFVGFLILMLKNS